MTVSVHGEGAREGGFTLLEIVVALAVIATLAGTIAPLMSAVQRAEAIDTARSELNAIADGMARYYYENGRFPAAVNTSGFYGVHVLPGIGDERLRDQWGTRGFYRVVRTTSPDIATVYSIGDNGRNDGVAAETLKVVVYGAQPGLARTRERLRVIVAAMTRHQNNGGTLTGTWSTDHAAMGLPSAYLRDGFRRAFRLDGPGMTPRSSGADRVFDTADDILP